MKAQLEDTPRQWVSLNNRAKSEKQKQKIIEMTDEGIVTNDDAENNTENNAENNASAKPVKTQTQQRKLPVAEATEETSESPVAKSSNNRNDSVTQNPLSVTPAERMPPMPE